MICNIPPVQHQQRYNRTQTTTAVAAGLHSKGSAVDRSAIAAAGPSTPSILNTVKLTVVGQRTTAQSHALMVTGIHGDYGDPCLQALLELIGRLLAEAALRGSGQRHNSPS